VRSGPEQRARVCEPQRDGGEGLEHKVRWEDGFLERGELGAREGAVRSYAADEGLEDGGADEGAVAEGC
jgi:hypothetical protein